ncbi:MAG: hypothetical protein AB8G14_00510 [Ilumatobacter sp.]
MTRFNRDLPGRLERDLHQISDQASPSSTAWEAIRHRIDEQDKRAASGTEPTVEVIMLDPETNKYSKRPRTGMLVAASVAALTLVGGLIVVANRDGEPAPADQPEPAPTVPATDPAIGGDPAPVVDEEASPVTVDPEGEALPQVEPPAQGAFVPNCTNGDPVPDPDNARLVLESDCEFGAVGVLPFAGDQLLEVSVLQDVGTPETPATAFVSLGNDGFMNAGLNWGGFTRGSYVGVAEGIDDYAGTAVFLSDFSSQNADGSNRVSDGRWWTNAEPQPGATGDFPTVAEISIACADTSPSTNEPTTVFECTYDGEDIARFMPESERHVGRIIPADFGPTQNGPSSVLSSDFFSTTSEDGMVIRSGVYATFRYFVWSGLRVGTGEFEGSLLHESGWGQTSSPGDPSSFEGVIQLSIIPIDS